MCYQTLSSNYQTTPVSEMTYTVSSGTLNPSIPYLSNYSFGHCIWPQFSSLYEVTLRRFAFYYVRISTECTFLVVSYNVVRIAPFARHLTRESVFVVMQHVVRTSFSVTTQVAVSQIDGSVTETMIVETCLTNRTALLLAVSINTVHWRPVPCTGPC